MSQSRPSNAGLPSPAAASAPGDLATVRVAVPSCALDDDGLRLQRERQARLAPSVAHVTRDGLTVSIVFAPGFDRGALEEMLAVERRCCPFFEFHLEEAERRLDVGVHDPQHTPALEALSWSLGAAPSGA
jgi:hypothetical protein